MKQLLLNWRIWLFAGVLAVFTAISYVNSQNAPQQFPPYVSDSPSPSGTKAFYTYLSETYSDVSRWSAEPSMLPGGEGGNLLIMIEPHFVPPETDMAHYRAFIEAGNTLLLVSESPVDLFAVETADHFFHDEDGFVSTDDGERHEADTESVIRLVEDEDDDVLLSDVHGTKALKRSMGDGVLIAANAPDWFTNSMILEEGHTELVISLLGEGMQEAGGSILVDEYIHEGQPGAAALYPQWFLIILLQGALIVLLWLWLKGKRFGPIYEPREATVRFSDESLQATAAWYMKLKGPGLRDSLQIQADFVRQLMQEKWGVPVRKEWAEVTEEISRRRPHEPDVDIETFVSGLTRVLANEDVTKKEFTYWSRKLDELRNEVEDR